MIRITNRTKVQHNKRYIRSNSARVIVITEFKIGSLQKNISARVLELQLHRPHPAVYRDSCDA